MIIRSNLLKWIFVIILTFIGLWGTKGIVLQDDVLDLLPGQAIRTDIEILQRLGLVNRIFISLEMNGSDQGSNEEQISKLTHNAEMLGVDLTNSKMFREVVYRLDEGYEWFAFDQLWNYLPALSDTESLGIISDRLSPSALNTIILKDFVQLNSPAGIPLVNQVRRDPLGLIGLLLKRLEGLKGEFSMMIHDGYFLSTDKQSCLIWAESISPLTDSVHAQKIMDVIKGSLQRTNESGIKVRIIGTLPHTLANSSLVKNDLRTLLPLASICLLVFLFFFLGGYRSVLIMLIPLMAAPLAIAALNVIYDGISSIALGFGIVLMGIAVDFSIHLFITLSSEKNLSVGLNKITKPIILGALTTIGVFCVLLFSEVPSHRQMATLAIVGLLFALFFSFLLIPTIIPRTSRSGKSELPEEVGSSFDKPKWAYTKIGLWLFLIFFGCLSWTQLHYNGDLRSLDVPNSKVMEDEEVFRNTWHNNETQTLIVAQGKSMEDVLRKNDIVFQKLNSLNIEGVQSLSAILPSLQTQTKNIARWSQFWGGNRETAQTNIKKISGEIGFTPDAFSPFFAWLSKPLRPLKAEFLLSSPLRPILISMLRTPTSESKQLHENNFLVTTIVPDGDNVYPALKKILGHEKNVTIISNSKWRSQVEKLMRHDIIRLSTAAGLLIIFLVSLYFRNVRQTLAALAPVLSALSAMAVFSFLTTKQLNMMHVLMGIMVIGISVDYGIFVVFSKIKGSSKTSSRAVSICAVSTLIGFGVLAIADHYALSALGVTVLVGIGAAWPTAIVITPVILAVRFDDRLT